MRAGITVVNAILMAAVGFACVYAANAGITAALVSAGIACLLAAFTTLWTLRDVQSDIQDILVSAKLSERGVPSQTSERVPLLSELGTSVRALSEQLHQTKVELMRTNVRARAVLDALGEAVIAIGEDGMIEATNGTALEYLRDKDIEGKTLLEASRSPRLQDAASQAIDGDVVEDEFDLLPDSRRVSLLATPKADGGCVLVMRDVTEVRRLERIRRDFVANVSHELRTPVSVICANAETLLDDPGEHDEIQEKLLQATMRNAERLSNLITDLLDLSRLESGSYQGNFTEIDLQEAAARVVELLAKKAEGKGIGIENSVPADLSVFADVQALEQILYNYLDNAIKYTPDNGHIDVGAHVVNDLVHVAVSDNGPGIPPKHRPRIFERFYRVDPGRSKDLGGTGLGLSICKHLAELNQGTVGYEASERGGASFWLRLPQPAGQNAIVAATQ